MICVRCGYCCKQMMVIIVDDSAKGPIEGNLIAHWGQGIPCKHLRGNKSGEYSCIIHDEPWYSKTPCATHTQIEQGNTVCRMGEYILNNESGRYSNF